MMLTVEFFDGDVPTDHSIKGSAYKWRSGKLMQITPCTPGPHENTYVAFILVSKMDHDNRHYAGVGDKIILPVKLTYVRVKGTSIPLFGS